MGKKAAIKKKKKYFTLAETLWKIGAPILVAVAKTVLEGKVPYLR